MTQENQKLATVAIKFRDRTQDSIIFDNVIGYQVGGSAILVAIDTGVTRIYPLDLVAEIEHIVHENEPAAE